MSDAPLQQPQQTKPTEDGDGDKTVPPSQPEAAKGPHTSALPPFARGGRAVERAAKLDREGHTEATAAAGGHGQLKKQPYLPPGQGEAM